MYVPPIPYFTSHSLTRRDRSATPPPPPPPPFRTTRSIGRSVDRRRAERGGIRRRASRRSPRSASSSARFSFVRSNHRLVVGERYLIRFFCCVIDLCCTSRSARSIGRPTVQVFGLGSGPLLVPSQLAVWLRMLESFRFARSRVSCSMFRPTHVGSARSACRPIVVRCFDSFCWFARIFRSFVRSCDVAGSAPQASAALRASALRSMVRTTTNTTLG
jgi:hypothetical protein